MNKDMDKKISELLKRYNLSDNKYVKPYYASGDILIVEDVWDTRLIIGGSKIQISNNLANTCMELYLQKRIKIYNAFNIPEDLQKMSVGETVRTKTGYECGAEQFCRLVVTAVCFNRDEYDIDELEKLIPTDPEKYNYMLYVLRNHSWRLISNGIRYGCGYRVKSGKLQYYAFYGEPNGNSDYFTFFEISEREYANIQKEYPKENHGADYDREKFQKKYINGHKVIDGGWDKLPDPVIETF